LPVVRFDDVFVLLDARCASRSPSSTSGAIVSPPLAPLLESKFVVEGELKPDIAQDLQERIEALLRRYRRPNALLLLEDKP
jgi:hypothetical protein